MTNETMKDGERAAIRAAAFAEAASVDAKVIAMLMTRGLVSRTDVDVALAAVAALPSDARTASQATVSGDEPVAEWQCRYMGDPRQAGYWRRTDNPPWAKESYEKHGGEPDKNGWQVRPLYARAAAPQAGATLTDEQIDVRVRAVCHSDPLTKDGEYCLTALP